LHWRADVNVEPEQADATHCVPLTYFRQAPAPSHVPSHPQVDGDVVYAALQNPDKLGLRRRRQLEVQTPDGAYALRIRLIVLDKPGHDPGRREGALVVGLDKIPAGIRETVRFQQLKPR
jgi:hypothetical protein